MATHVPFDEAEQTLRNLGIVVARGRGGAHRAVVAGFRARFTARVVIALASGLVLIGTGLAGWLR